MSTGNERVKEWLEQTWPEAEIQRLNISTGRDSDAWDVYRSGAKPFRVEVTGQLRAFLPRLDERLTEASELKSRIEANAPGTVILHSDGIDFREPKE